MLLLRQLCGLILKIILQTVIFVHIIWKATIKKIHKNIVYPLVSSITAAKKGRNEKLHSSDILTSSELIDANKNVPSPETENSDVEEYEKLS